jgi:AraC family transcriptional regulator of arabinose operon
MLKKVVYSLNNSLTNIGLILEQFGYEKCESSYGFGPAVRDYYLIHFIRNGKGIYYYKDNQIEVCKDEFFLIPPNEVTYYESDKKEPWEYFWIAFNGVEAKHLLKKVGFSDGNRKLKYYLNDEFCIYDMIYSLANRKIVDESDKIFEIAKLYEIISWLRRNYERKYSSLKTRNPADKYLRTAIDYLERSFTLQITIAQLADYVGIDRTQLFRYFKEELGVSPKQYLVNLRMKRAEELLKTTDLTIKEITFSVGYVDAYLFSKMFKKTYGVSPKEFRSKFQRIYSKHGNICYE